MNRGIAIAVVLVLGTYIAASSIYTVNEVEQMIITQFGKPVGEPVTSAGLKLKVPFIQDVNPIDKRVLEWDGAPSDMPTKDKLYISVDLFAAGGLQIPSSISFGYAMNAVRNRASTTFWAARPATRSPNMS